MINARSEKSNNLVKHFKGWCLSLFISALDQVQLPIRPCEEIDFILFLLKSGSKPYNDNKRHYRAIVCHILRCQIWVRIAWKSPLKENEGINEFNMYLIFFMNKHVCILKSALMCFPATDNAGNTLITLWLITLVGWLFWV